MSKRRSIRRIFGSEELGLVLKHAFYSKVGGLTKNEQELLDSCDNMVQLSEAIELIESFNPRLITEFYNHVQKLGTLVGKGLLPVQIEQIFSDAELNLSETEMEHLDSNLSRLKADIREGKYARLVRGIERNGGTVNDILVDSNARVLRNMIQSLITKRPTSAIDTLFTIWESRLEKTLEKPQEMNSKSVILRCLHKRNQTVDAIRATDSTINCLNSTKWNFRTSIHEGKFEKQKNYMFGGDVIANANADPLTLIIQIETTSIFPQREAIGFIYVHFGEIDGKLAVLLDTVYMQNSNEAAIQDIINEVEKWISKPMGASWQVVSTRFDSYHPGPEYSNEPIEVKLLQAIKVGRKPINRTRDDIGVGANKFRKTDDKVWHKKIK
jgi:hypothetical protein